MDKQQQQEKQEIILNYLRDFCAQKLNEEYFALAEKLTKKLGRKKSNPLISGKPEIWAAAIIHAIGSINFLFDKSARPYISIDDLNAFFGTSKSTTGNKSKQIREMLKLRHWDNEFSTKRMRNNNPFAAFVMVDGIIVPVNSLPEEYQEAVRKARAQGIDISFSTK